MPREMSDEMFDFFGDAQVIGEDEFGASFTFDDKCAFLKSLYKNYVEAGRPKSQKEWLRSTLPKAFPCARKRPDWHGDCAMWPFKNKRPMIFAGQMELSPAGKDMESVFGDGSTLYVSCSARKSPCLNTANGAFDCTLRWSISTTRCEVCMLSATLKETSSALRQGEARRRENVDRAP
ncbi:MAG TPA: hypothetical protein VGP72_18035 [Planctomycetota bacterium]